jgi:hypothetical protein
MFIDETAEVINMENERNIALRRVFENLRTGHYPNKKEATLCVHISINVKGVFAPRKMRIKPEKEIKYMCIPCINCQRLSNYPRH